MIQRSAVDFSGGADQWSTLGVASGASAAAEASRTGPYGLHLHPVAENSGVPHQFSASVDNVFVAPFHIQFPGALPLEDASISYWGETSAANISGYRLEFDVATGKLKVVTVDGSGAIVATSLGPEVDPDIWFRIDFRFLGSAFPGGRSFDWMIAEDGGSAEAQPQLGGASGPGGLLFWTFGRTTAQTFSCYVDDVWMAYTNDDDPDQSEVDALYPLGAGYVKRLAPVSNGPNVGEGSFAAYAGAIEDSWQLLADLPMDTSPGYVEQNVVGLGDYLQYAFESLAPFETDIHAVSPVMEVRSSGLSSNNAKLHIVDGVNDQTVYDGIWLATGETIRGEDIIDGQPFTRSEVNALLARWGYSSDVVSTPRLGGLALAVAVGEFVASEIVPEGDTIYYDQLRATE